ncbi:bile acid germinant receptor pseudoprotease CspC [Paraclostridium bifermentans]|uniref:bile acid germinant receptor pseudoprotease CspC n=1 Tax=Paraclostridium bifermentans TaxID=1490 RepID=UPI00374F3548
MLKPYIVTYNGKKLKLEEELKDNNINEYNILNNKIAIIYVDENFLESNFYNFDSIYDWTASRPLSSLIEISNNKESGESPREISGVNYIDQNPYISSYGKDTVIAIIDSGINYLHPDFINTDGSSKIISIWDQESKIGKPPNTINLGSEFKKEEINEYIKLKDDSLTKDLTGTGTIAAGICSGNGNINRLYKGISPRSELAIVKLREYEGIYKEGIKSYELSDFLLAVKYIIEISKNYKKTFILNLTVAERSKSIIVTNFLDTFDELKSGGYILVSGLGNEGNTDIHYSGKFENMDEFEDILIQVGDQKNLDITISCVGPDKISANLISPSGEVGYPAQYAPDEKMYKGTFNVEGTSYSSKFIYPWIKSGTEEIIISLNNVKQGIWTLRLMPEFILIGEYNIYLPNKNLIDKETRFINSNYFSTTNIFATTENVIAVGGFNNKTDSMWIESSVGTLNQVPIRPDIVAPSVDIMGCYENDSYTKASGTGIASSIASGVTALIVDFLITQSDLNKSLIFTDVIKTYLMVGADRLDIYKYPNVRMGYGILNFKDTIQQIAKNIR